MALSNGIGAFGALTKITERSLAPARYPSTRVDTRSFNPWGHYVHTNDDFRDGVWRFCSERGLGTTVAGASVRKQRLSSWCERRDTGHCRVFASGEREDCSLSNRCPGSTEGAIHGAVNLARKQGAKVSRAHLHHLNPFPKNLGDVLGRFEKVLLPEMNLGQLALLLRAKYLKDIVSYNKVEGKPFYRFEVLAKIQEVLAS